jgi:hypothetical protein
MAKTHYWFGTDRDNPTIFDWLYSNGAVVLDETFSSADYLSAKSFTLHFPAVGPLVFWPETIDVVQYREGSSKWKAAMLARLSQKENPGRRIIDTDQSPMALIFVPYKKNQRFWTTGELHFKGTNLKESFPELNKLNTQFERWLRKHELIYNWAGRELFSPFDYNLGVTEGVVRKIFALPDAYKLLQSGNIMIDYHMNDFPFEKFLKKLRLRGIDC